MDLENLIDEDMENASIRARGDEESVSLASGYTEERPEKGCGDLLSLQQDLQETVENIEKESVNDLEAIVEEQRSQ
ncbi:uncharacterized protein RB166_021783 [Leptodactylus fuscus]